ncbi:MAG: hypothetical protein K2J74_01585, partial [Muribaculaceae bacterium]|nr:hypothetical protein [Muribaculaceae bacterium]
MRIYKEVGSTDNFELIGEAEISAGAFVDMQSNPNIRKNRYAIALSTVYDGETALSAVHGSVHLMVNIGLGKSINLMWNAYEGGVVNQYYILRGATPDNLEVYETLTGHETSFTDVNVPSEGCYYAISYGNLMVTGTRAGNTVSGSNVVSSRDATEVTFVESVTIKCVEKEVSLTNEQRVLHLYAMVTPARATYGDVQWRIIEGDEYTVVSSEGTLTVLDKSYKGNIKVEAKAKDGSGVTDIISIPCDYEGSGVDGIMTDGDTLSISFDSREGVLNISGVSKMETIRIVSMNGSTVKSAVIYADTKMILNIAPGIYI